MTAFNARLAGRTPKGRNKKDGATGRNPGATNFEKHGFTFIMPPSQWAYTWQGVFPVFQVAPGRVNGLAGMVARCPKSGVIEWFPYGTTPADIKARLDVLISEIMQHDAALAEEPLDEVDFDDFMVGEWVRS